METRRYHPAIMLFGIAKAIRNWIVPLIIVTIFNNADNWWGTYAKYIVLAIMLLSIVSDILTWFTEKYAADEHAFHLYRGIFSKTSRTVPFEKIQNITKHTNLLHRLLGLTAIKFETGSKEKAVEFKVLTKEEASRLEQLTITDSPEQADIGQRATSEEDDLIRDDTVSEQTVSIAQERTVHFKPTKKELIKASFTSLSFLLVPPLLVSFVLKFDIFFDWSDVRQYLPLLKIWWISTLGLIGIIVVSLLFGMWRVLLKYSNYELASDEANIYIQTGLVSESFFSIRKDRVQGIEISQPILHRLLGLAKVKLISTGSLDISEDTEEINSLYPYFTLKQAQQLIAAILPEYEVEFSMHKLQQKVLFYRLLQPSFIWLAVTITMYFWRPEVFGYQISWWMVSIIALILIEGYRYLNFKHSGYLVSERFLQMKTGAFTTTLFVTKRNKMIEISKTQNPLQRWLGLATIESINRAKPVLHNEMKDVPAREAERFYIWFHQRANDVRRQ
ncbi:putative membrane protein [Terribacillus halophilus]|uniref:Putative membrane protein n=1 Tax=Terribacillus halophilus TaxID=361279 RepID=A0A1G6QUG2_9BACI|nr:PH domain-containing protein [Terribacillus halophilus]SDC95941.1 putative membrane protein [Terribacillus halophilus]